MRAHIRKHAKRVSMPALIVRRIRMSRVESFIFSFSGIDIHYCVPVPLTAAPEKPVGISPPPPPPGDTSRNRRARVKNHLRLYERSEWRDISRVRIWFSDLVLPPYPAYGTIFRSTRSKTSGHNGMGGERILRVVAGVYPRSQAVS